MGGFLWMHGGFVAMPDSTKSLFEPVFGQYGELLPARLTLHDGTIEPLWLFNCVHFAATLDRERSTFSGPLQNRIYAFTGKNLVSGTIYRDPILANALFFVSNDSGSSFLEFCAAHDLQGLGFEPMNREAGRGEPKSAPRDAKATAAAKPPPASQARKAHTYGSKQEEWQRKTLDYVAAVNAFITRSLAGSSEATGEAPQPPGRSHLVEDALAAVREANRIGQLESLRAQWPPAHEPLVEVIEKNGQAIRVLCVLPDKSIVARIGEPDEPGKTIHISGDSVHTLDEVGFFGRSPNRRYFAIARPDGVAVLDGWDGPQVGMFPWPTGLEGIPEDAYAEPLAAPPKPSRLIPFPDGRRVLLVSSQGVFVLAEDRVERLLPNSEQLQADVEWQQEGAPDEPLAVELAMEHGAVSHDGKWIAVGSQDSAHLIFDEQLQVAGEIATDGDYPHYALFNADDTMLAINACHFYSGSTLGVPIDLLPGLKLDEYQDDARILDLEDGARVYAGTSRGNAFIIGDASGYVRAFDTEGNPLWNLHIGSTVGDMDISDDGELLVVSTYAGFISMIRMDAGGQAPHQIGNSMHTETRRWLIWKNEAQPLIW